MTTTTHTTVPNTTGPNTTVRKKRPMFLKILIALAVLIIAFLIVVAMQPPQFRVTRSATISAPPQAVFAQINDFRNWEAWSPWAKKDPNAKSTFEGPASGTGAVFKWSGNKEVGEGQMTITESQPHERVLIRLDFIKPFKSTANTEYTFKPQGDQTEVTWSMTGTNNFIGKAMCLFMDMDKMVGGDFEKALANIKSVTEAPAARQ